MTTETPQVLIVGAGPTGLTLAIELQRRGVPFRLIERQTERHQQSRATDIQARTLEVFYDMGVVDAIVEAGIKRETVSIYANGERALHIRIDGVDTPYCYTIGLGQQFTEEILEARLIELGGQVERGVRLGYLIQPGDRAVATLLHADHTWEDRAFDYVVGCDGAHSVVRHAMGFQFSGSTFEQTFFLADLTARSGLDPTDTAVYGSEHGLLVALPIPGEPGRIRIFGDMNPDEAHEDPDLEALNAMVDARTFGAADLCNLGWHALFRVHSRQVSDYRKRRALLCGDAAHVNSPAGGHGMNLGIQDAYNLGWKLALVARGAADESLLDSYTRERHPIGQAILTETDLETRAVLWRQPFAHKAMGLMLQAASALPAVRRQMLATQLELEPGYADSPIVGEHRASIMDATLVLESSSEQPSLQSHRHFSDGPAPGDRAPDVSIGAGGMLFSVMATPGHTLLLFDGASKTDAGYATLDRIASRIERTLGPHIDTHVVVMGEERPPAMTWRGSVLFDAERALHDRYGADTECLYLIRPDGYVGFRSQPVDEDALFEHLGRIFTQRG